MPARTVQPAVALIIASVITGTGGVLVATAASAPESLRAEAFGVVALLAATVVLQFRSLDIGGKGSIGVAAIAMATAAVVVGTAVAIGIALVAAMIQWRRRQGPMHRALFDGGNFALSSAAAGFTFAALADKPAFTFITFVAATLAGGAYVLVNNALLCFVMSVDEGRSARKVWDERFRWAVPSFAAFAPIVALAVLAYEGADVLGIVVVLSTPLLVSWVMKARLRRVNFPVEDALRLERP